MDVDADALVALEPCRNAAGSPQLGAVALEDRLHLDHVGFDATGHGHDLVDASYAVGAEAEVDDDVDGRGDGRHDEAGRDVVAGEKRERAHLDQRLARTVGVQRAHARAGRS